MRDADRKWFPASDGPRHRASASVAEWFASLPKWRTVPEDQPVNAAAVKPKPEPEPDEPEQVEDGPAESLEGGLNHTGGQLYGVSAEELARMRASQAAYAAKKVAYMRAVRER